MRIAVLSDTHDQFPPSLSGRLRGADEIWHLGDVCDEAIVDHLQTLGPPVRVVQGNGDLDSDWPVSLLLERERVKFFLTHIPPSQAPGGCHVLLHGHNHRPRDEQRGAVRWLSPGAVTAPRGGSAAGFAWLTVRDGAVTGWELEEL